MRRDLVRIVCILLIGALVASACGSDATTTTEPLAPTTTTSTTEPPPLLAQPVLVSERSTDSVVDPEVAGEAITSFGNDLFAAARAEGPDENVTLSPMSIAIALAMVEPGANGDGLSQLHDVLNIDDPERFHASMNALERDLEARVPSEFGPNNDPGEITVRIANSAYLQEGFPFEDAYLDAIGTNYGTVLNEVDFRPDPDAVAHEINDWIAEQTEDRIVDLIGDGVLTESTVLTLVNALYLNASWIAPFEESRTTEEAFSLLDGTTTQIQLMNGSGGSSARGDGWVGATKSYTGGLRIQFILPDEGRFEEVAGRLPAVFEDYSEVVTDGTRLRIPNFESRTTTELKDPLEALGLTAPFEGGNLLGIANTPTLAVGDVLHETFVAIDEQGTEAAAATVVLFSAFSGPPSPPVPVILDRPFFYRITDWFSGTTLFIGQITNPNA